MTSAPRSEDGAAGLGDPQVVDAGFAAGHQAVGVELPEFVAVAAPPLAGGVAPLVLEGHGDPVVCEGPQLLAERVVVFLVPLAGQEGHDLLAAGQELVA